MIGSHLMWIFLQLSAVVIALPDSRLTGNLDGGVALSGQTSHHGAVPFDTKGTSSELCIVLQVLAPLGPSLSR
eukprot:m.131540 g.131540  ORF g.131540 m.131540 type:complete len:73 (-) comp52368_c0_seq18:1973-2191(-)